ncbi:YopX family protein [Patescibacteria group bacterium AH-259-L07]|nr:YopX family protein [Patescibacteria group bacterium AH-259-L07]
MREIKFRGVDENNKIYNLSAINLKTMAGFCKVKGRVEEEWCKFEKFIQFTGLKDKNGKEIYEGDILMSRNFSGEFSKIEVIYSQKEGAFTTKEGYLFARYENKIIGNIYENPELLKN